MRKLAITAIAGLGIAAVSLGAVAAIGRQQFPNSDFNIPWFGGPVCGHTNTDSAATSRTIAWDGSDQAILSIPVHARYAPGNDTMLHISGDPALIAHIQLRDGHIGLDCHNWDGDDRDVEITLPGRTFHKFAIQGSGRMQLDGLNQDRLKLAISGSGTIRADGNIGQLDTRISGSGGIHASGHAKQLDVRISGSGDADLGAVSADSAEVRISGSGKADIAPRQKADIHIAGSGNVILHSHPEQMDTRISGSGHIRTVEDGI